MRLGLDVSGVKKFPVEDMFLKKSVHASVCPSVCLCTKYYFLSKGRQGY